MPGWCSRRIRRFMFVSFLCALGPTMTIGIATAEEDKNLERTFRGTINEKWEIQLILRSTEPISGSYFYERVKKPIPLEARLDEAHNWIVTEFDDKRNITGQFTGDIFGLVFSGTWTNADKSKSYPFHLVETNRHWQGEISPYRSTEPLVAQAKKGKKDAQFHLAFLYYYGQGGLKHDMKEAVGWYKKAAAQGHARAQFILGALYLDGHGVKKDFGAALRLINEAATSGDQRAKDWLADLSKNSWKRPYYEKRQVTKDVQYYVDLIEADPAEAEIGLKALGTPAAKGYLAYMYYEGKATVPNPSEVVNSLLQEALSVGEKKNPNEINTAFYGAINDSFYTVGRSTLFGHMRELAGDVTVPCDIFGTDPHEALEAFQPHYGGCRDVSPSVCGDAVLSDSVPAMTKYLSERKKLSGIKEVCDIGTQRCAIGKGQVVHDTLWNMAPQMFLDKSDCLGPCEEDDTKLG
jgi:Sel1 repeat